MDTTVSTTSDGSMSAYVSINIHVIAGNPYQVRSQEDAEAVAELATNIERNGLLQPPTVRRNLDTPGGYELAFGHTRLAAFKLLESQGKGFTEMPCFVRELSDLQMFEFAVAENIKRRDMNPVERARAMQKYMDTFGKNSQETAEFFGCDAATVRGSIRLLKLPQAAQDELAEGGITVHAARQLLMLVRVGPELVEGAVKELLKGEEPSRVLGNALDSLVYKNKAIKMMPGWKNGEPRAGEGLWKLDVTCKDFAKYMPPLAGLEGLDMRLAKKVVQATDVDWKQIEGWARKLQGGLVAPAALIDQGADAETIERLDQLINPPACTSCSFYAKVKGDHYCTWKVCHTRKKEAWSMRELFQLSEKLEIPLLGKEEARGGFITLDSNYNKAEGELVQAKNPHLRLQIKAQSYDHAHTGSPIVQLVTVDPKQIQAAKEQDEKVSSMRGRTESDKDREEREKRWKRQRALQEASEKFSENEAEPIFATLLNGLKNLGFLMALSRLDERDMEREEKEKEKKLTREEKQQRCRIEIISAIIEDVADYEILQQGPVVYADHLQGLAKTWGLELPADWMELAGKYEPEKEEVKA